MPLAPTLPWKAGLSHMSKEFVEEVFAPHRATHFAADGSGERMRSQDVLREPADYGKIFWRVVFARSRVVLVEYDIENPMEVVFDAPVGADKFGQLGRRELAGK